jgi:membrane protease YdiL (CAAX protease family)
MSDTYTPKDHPIRRARALLGLIAGLLCGWTIWATLILPSLPPAEGMAHTIRSVGVRVLLWVVPSGAYLWLRYRRHALFGLRLNLPPQAAHWRVAIAITAAAGFTVSLDVARKLAVPTSEVWLRLLQTYEPSFPTTEVFEELIFRGVVLSELLVLLGAAAEPRAQDVAMRGRAWLANVTASLVFVGLHWPWWIYTHGVGEWFWMNTAGVFLISLVLGMLFIRTRSLWPCVVLHWLNNALSALASS